MSSGKSRCAFFFELREKGITATEMTFRLLNFAGKNINSASGFSSFIRHTFDKNVDGFSTLESLKGMTVTPVSSPNLSSFLTRFATNHFKTYKKRF